MLRSFNMPGTRVRKWFFNPAKAALAVEEQPRVEDLAEQVGQLMLRVDTCEQNADALRQRVNAVKRKINTAKTAATT